MAQLQAEERRIWRCTEGVGKEREVWVNRRKRGEEKRERVKKHNVYVFYAQLSIFRTTIFLLPLPSHQFLPLTALSGTKPLIRRHLLGYVLQTVVYTHCCEHGRVLRISFSLSLSFLCLPLTLFIPHWLTCFTSTAVISTAFTELINGAEGWVLLNWDNSFSLSLAHMDNYIEKKREAA